MFDAEKQLTKIIKRNRFITENNLWLFILIIIFELAIIIKAAIKILNTISVDDNISIIENDEIDIAVGLVNNIIEKKVNNIRNAAIVHQ